MIKEDQNGNSRWNYIILTALLLPFLSYLLIQAVYSGMAYVYQYRLNATIDQWGKNKAPQGLEKWVKTETLALASLRDNEHNVDIINALGRLYDYRSVRMSTTRKQQLAFGRKAIVYYRQVTRLRPAWPYGWMNLATSKARLGEVDQEFSQALQKLLRLGPWEKNTLPTIIQLSLYAWPYMESSLRKPILAYLFIAQKKRGNDVFKALTGAGQLKRYCAIVTHKGEKASFCP